MKFNYLTKIALHIVFGFLLYYVGFFPRLFFFGVIAYFLVNIIKALPNEKTISVISACAYIVGVEVLFRMTKAGIFYESSKYLVILFMVMGMIFSGLSNRSYPYLLYLFLLIPSIVVASTNIGLDSNLRKNIAFVLSGPVCLGISALFCYNKKINSNQLNSILLYLGLPIVSLTTYLFLYTVRLEDIFSGTQSNFAASGGFGPNQVSTVLGIGMFVFCVNFFLKSKSMLVQVVNIMIFAAISYRGIITFSRGGIFTAILMILAFLTIYYFKSNYRNRRIVSISLVLLLLVSVATWVVSSSQTSGLIDKRYANQDAKGREKEDISAGRVEIFIGELEGFIDNPFLGVGASGMKEQRLQNSGEVVATHNELSRILSEHGILGVIILVILFFAPLFYRANNTRNILFYAFLIFWFATINHSAMRIAAPGFIYALALLNITYEKRSVHRKRLIEHR
ncbi:MAG: O-antigen ligase family protein [Winogradskyella sp.]|uniref:O-antigen ligase family protein n=1 Tax=Winogradskyella sp. TaxID=1883156 RepID=UPI0025CC5E93|nr:O-antigen ligase family protein [Winogradskyella sp.]NRB59401.1 O-antigen ligase family protein [Winogradskyella sp.]